MLLCLVVNVDQRDSAGAGFEHLAAGLIQWRHGVNGNGFNWCSANCLFDFAKGGEFEAVNFRELVWVLTVVLDNVDVIGGGEEAGEGGG